MNKWVSYKDGNYYVRINLADGTKIRENDLDNFRADFPESIDIKITNSCDMGCPMCHENSIPNGAHGDIMNLKFIDNLHPYTELAIGGGNPLEHPDLEAFLRKCKSLKLIPSMTINQTHFMKNIDFVKMLVSEDLIYGLGVSLTNPTPEFINQIKKFPNAVIHVIAGLIPIYKLEEISKLDLKILILGYKQFRRGENLYLHESTTIDSKINELKEILPVIIKNNWFKVVSFDNLAIKQLDPRRVLSDSEWDEFYMGDDGFATMYVDCVKEEFARSSTSIDRYPITDNIVDMFNVIRT